MQTSAETPAAGQTEALIDAALRHVPFEGMNRRAIAAGARDLGIAPTLAEVLIPRGGAGLAAAYHRRGDTRLKAALAASAPSGRFRDRVAEAVMRRLDLADPELVRAGAAVLALPANAGLGAKLTGETADLIWNALGDTSADVSWWTKRITLGGVIGATVLYWLDDQSSGKSETRAFLERRLDQVMAIEKVKAQARRVPGLAAITRAATGWIRAPQSAGRTGAPR